MKAMLPLMIIVAAIGSAQDSVPANSSVTRLNSQEISERIRVRLESKGVRTKPPVLRKKAG
jgi:hypothetical protein